MTDHILIMRENMQAARQWAAKHGDVMALTSLMLNGPFDIPPQPHKGDGPERKLAVREANMRELMKQHHPLNVRYMVASLGVTWK
jgi:hypothetical protein